MERRDFTNYEKYEICDYYSTHKLVDVVKKYGVYPSLLHRWRKQFGYPNKVAGAWNSPQESVRGSIGYLVNGKFVTELEGLSSHDTILKIEGKFVPLKVVNGNSAAKNT